MSEKVFRTGSPGDLALPLQKAYADALARGHAFRLVLPALPYGPFHVSLGSVGGETIDLAVEGEGEKPVTLHGVSMSLRGRNVALANFVLKGTSSPASALSVQVTDSFEGRGLGFIGIRRHDRMSSEPIVQVTAAGQKGCNAMAALRDCWFLGNEGEGYTAVLSAPRTGRAFISRLLIERCAFIGNRTDAGIDPWFTGSLAVEGTFVLENGGEAWLRLRSPHAKTCLSDSFVSVPGRLAEFVTGPDAGREDFPPVETNGCRLLTTPVSPEDLSGTGNSYGPPVHGFDWRDAIPFAERPPDRKVLEEVFQAGP